ncbi:MAG TPA: tetratricopeptide repeat protein [Gemmatimonadaceae bacterium]|nr:tetratricopeptide repeat protein [Gemmatimonadaceae bacterium]
MRRRIRVGLVPVVVLAAGACFATREDVRLLQNQMQAAQTQAAQADSQRQAQLDRVIEQLGLVNDSLGRIGGQLTKFQGDVEGQVYAMGQQLIQIQELTGQSQRRLQELRAGLEAQRATAVAPPVVSAPPPTDSAAVGGGGGAGTSPGQTPSSSGATVSTSTGAVSGTNGTPGPNQLYEMALDQLRRGSTTAARTALLDLLRQYPNADVAADAQFYVAETFAKEHDTAAADSGYRLVAQRFPASSRASQALFKHALVLQAQHKVQAARAAYEEVIKKYPRSDEAVLAKDRLRVVR